MEKSEQNEVEYMMQTQEKKLWIDTRLNSEEMDFLRHQAMVTDKNGSRKSKLIEDKDNWFFKTALKKLTEELFYDDWNNYRKYHIVKEKEEPQFEMNRFWVNYQRQYEFNPLHFHGGLYSFVVFVEIPTHWKEQHEMNKDDFRAPVASDFVFVWGGEENEIFKKNLQLSSEDEGRILFFPAWLQHMVYPFYECEEERVTISGNIDFYDPNRPKEQKISTGEYEEKKKMLELVENSAEFMKKELKMMEKEKEKEGLN